MNNPFQLPELFTLSGIKVTSEGVASVVSAGCGNGGGCQTGGGCSSGGALDSFTAE